MPFERYLQPPDDRQSNSYSTEADSSASASGTHAFARSPYDDGSRAAMFGIDSSTFAGNVQFQMPQFMYAGPPTLAPGGGAEVLPAGFMGSMASSWFANSGFTPKPAEEIYPASPSKYQPSTYSTLSAHLSAGNSPSGAIVQHRLQSRLSALASSHSKPATSDASLTDVIAAATQVASMGGPSLSAPSSLNLPVYSSSGFDLLSILGRIATRQNPNIVIGPVDMSCSFVVVDVRRYDSPIVYASPTFCRLTGYNEHEVLGRNCRFLQSPGGQVQKGEQRRYTAPEAVYHLRKSLVADKECQTSIINYKKDGTAFINLVTVIPITGGVSNRQDEAEDVVYHVGFQVDLSEQPNAILQKLRDGSYMVNYSSSHVGHLPIAGYPRDRRSRTYSVHALSKSLRNLLEDETFTSSFSSPTFTEEREDFNEGNQHLSLLLLDATPDFLLVLSLKGSFLYLAPSVCRILGYDPEELAGKSVVDYCHASDVVPLMRELKESSMVPAGPQESYNNTNGLASLSGIPKAVDLLFRARTKSGEYIWIECRGRLHVEPGKGRKAIILSARPRSMPVLNWKSIPFAHSTTSSIAAGHACATERITEVWGILSTGGTVLFMGAAIKDILGWGVGEVIGMSVKDLVVSASRETIEDALRQYAARESNLPIGSFCEVTGKSGNRVNLNIVLYPPPSPPSISHNYPSLVICQIRYTTSPYHYEPTSLGHPNVFTELETSRSSSWQFELQQLKIENQRLSDDIEHLESMMISHDRRLAISTSPNGGYQQDSPLHMDTESDSWV